MFEIGDLIIGTKNCRYVCTNNKCLMVVERIIDRSNEMSVRILKHDEDRDLVGNDYIVDNNNNRFEKIDYDTYNTLFPGADGWSKEEIYAKIFKITGKDKSIKKDICTYVLADNVRKELIKEIKTLLNDYDYSATEEGINTILDCWVENKGHLIQMFEKSPNYNGKFQIVFDYDFPRMFDWGEVEVFSNWLYEIKNNYMEEVIVGNMSFEELSNRIDKLNTTICLFEENNFINTINNMTMHECYKELEKYIQLRNLYYQDDNITIHYNNAYDKEKFEIYKKIDNLQSRFITFQGFTETISKKDEDYFKNFFPECKIKAGQKTSRAINKVLSFLGVNQLKDYNKKFAKFSDAINPLKIKKHTVLSVHPVDYFTMSFGNSWSSCQTIDKNNIRGIDGEHVYHGQSSSGTESYMLDSTSFLFYTVSSDYNGNQLELQNKITRNMFHYNDNQLLQGRLYPQCHDTESNSFYRDIRQIVQKVIADLLEVPNMWTNKAGTDACRIVSSSYGTHYRDYFYYENCNVSTLKDDRDEHFKIYIGHKPICPKCGSTHELCRTINCC